MVANSKEETIGNWTEVIEQHHHILRIDFREIWHYRDLLLLFVRRDFVTSYKQTILGPIWFFLQPALTTLIFTLVFGRIAGLPTNGSPMILFYLTGITLWNYFSECLTRTSTVFKDNSLIFGKVYFPRLIIPLSIVTSNLLKLGVQFSLFLLVWLYYLNAGEISPNIYLVLTPYLIVLMAAISLGSGMIITALTTKYRDLAFLLNFGVQLLMYATPIIYPLSSINEYYKPLILANPLCSIIEIFRYGFLGEGTFSVGMLAYSTVFALVILGIGTIIFNKVEKSFMDTI